MTSTLTDYRSLSSCNCGWQRASPCKPRIPTRHRFRICAINNQESGSRFKEALQKGQPKFGVFLNSGNPLAAEQLSCSGYDWVLVLPCPTCYFQTSIHTFPTPIPHFIDFSRPDNLLARVFR
jgi:hypothetical protein